MSSDEEGFSSSDDLNSGRSSLQRSGSESSMLSTDSASGSSSEGFASQMSTQRSIKSSYTQTSSTGIVIDRSTATPSRLFSLALVNSNRFTLGMMIIITLNALSTALMTETYLSVTYGWYFSIFDFAFQGIYVAEMMLKFYAWRRLFVYSGWNIFDLVLVLFGFLDWMRYLDSSVSFGKSVQIVQLLRFFRILRVVRALRILRSIALFRTLQLLVGTLLRSLPAMSAVGLLLCLVMYISAVIATSLYEFADPMRFGSIGSSLMSCFQLLTLDDAFTFYDIISVTDPTIGVFLVAYIIIATFSINQMLIAIIMNNLEENRKHIVAREKRSAKRRKAQRVEQTNRNSLVGVPSLTSPNNFKDEKDIAHFNAQRKILDYYQKSVTETSDRERQLMMQYFMLLASVENESLWYQNQQEVMDRMVDQIAEQELL